MKTLSSKIFAFVFFIAASINIASAKDINPASAGKVVAAEKFAYSLYAINETTKFRLAFENQQGSAVSVKVYDEKGMLVFTDNIKNATEMKRNYDLAELGRGVYTVEISSGDFKTANRIAVGGRWGQIEPYSLQRLCFPVAERGCL